MKRTSLIQIWTRTCIASAAAAALGALAASGNAAEEVASIANPAIANPAVSKPPMANPPVADTMVQPAPPTQGRPTKRGAGVRNAAPPPGNLPPATFKLPADYSILNKRTIFARDGVAATPAGANANPEAMFALRGIVSDERSFLVFIEDTTAHRMMQLRPGDPVAGGKIGHICMDDFSFETGGASKRICVGQNLLGAPLPPVTPPPPQGPPGAEQGPKPDGPPKNAKPNKEPVFEIGPNGQRVRNIVAERAPG